MLQDMAAATVARELASYVRLRRRQVQGAIYAEEQAHRIESAQARMLRVCAWIQAILLIVDITRTRWTAVGLVFVVAPAAGWRWPPALMAYTCWSAADVLLVLVSLFLPNPWGLGALGGNVETLDWFVICARWLIDAVGATTSYMLIQTLSGHVPSDICYTFAWCG